MKLRYRIYWAFRYAKGLLLREPVCGDCLLRGCRGECCGAVT
jgi:hypothetical protein